MFGGIARLARILMPLAGNVGKKRVGVCLGNLSEE